MTPFVADNLARTLKNKKVLLGISGSIAAFKACDIIRNLRKVGAHVRVVPTENALQFVTKTTLETLSGHTIHTTLWENHGTHHIDAARWADIALVAPATANVLAKLAQGLADDLLSTELLAFQGPLFIAPAMNPAMYDHPATQGNVSTLQSRGVHILGPVVGNTSCGEEGLGRMLEPEEIVSHLALDLASPKDQTILVTLGPTRSHLDPVRYLTNRSSGLMGAALCWEASRRGYRVVAVTGPCEAPLPPNTQIIRVESAAEMLQAAQKVWPRCLAFLSAAAVLDWDVANISTQKLKKADGLSLQFQRNPDILKTLCDSRRPGQWILGFAAETQDLLNQGELKIQNKGCNFLFANDVSIPGQGFDSQANSGFWFERSPSGSIQTSPLGPDSKVALASLMFDRMESHWNLSSNRSEITEQYLKTNSIC